MSYYGRLVSFGGNYRALKSHQGRETASSPSFSIRKSISGYEDALMDFLQTGTASRGVNHLEISVQILASLSPSFDFLMRHHRGKIMPQ